MTTLEEFYKVGPGPSSSHTIGPMRITYDFYQRCTKLPADQLAKVTGLKVHLLREPQRHGQRATAPSGRRWPASSARNRRRSSPNSSTAWCRSRTRPSRSSWATRRSTVSLKDIIYDAPKGDFPHPNTMTCKLMGGDAVLYELEYYSVGGGFIEWKGYEPPKKGQPKYPYATMAELQKHARRQQAVGRPGRHGQRSGGVRQERGGDQRLHRQDPQRDGQHRQGRTEGAGEHAARARSS